LEHDSGYFERAVFRLADGTEINLITEGHYDKMNDLKKDDKVSITYKEEQWLSGEPDVNCWKEDIMKSLKKLPK
jgi:hypothetical protein